MDPFTAIGLAGNIITFLDFGYKLVSASKDIYTSASGASTYNDDLSYTTEQIQQLTASLKVAKPVATLSKHELSLLQVARDCEGVSDELAKLLDELKARKPGSKREAFKAAMRDWRKKNQKDNLELKLDRCKQQLNLELVNLSRTESLERLNKLIAHGQASEDELKSLAKNVDSLRLGCNVSCLSSEALDQVRSLLKLTDDAVLRVRQARVLDALRFELMNERYEDIKKAHQTTFDWIFSGDEVGTDSDTESESSVYENDTDEYDDGDTERRGKGGADGVNEANLVDSSQAPSPVSKIPCLISDDSIRHDDFAIFSDSENNELSDDSSFEWISDDTQPDNDVRVEMLSNDEADEESIEPVGASSRLRSLSPVPSDVDERLTEARDGFITWLKQETGIFYVSGKPGSGKSTLMKYLTRHPKTREYLTVWADGKKLVLGNFFFWKPGSVLQKSTKGLIRGILHCVLEECPDLLPLAFPVQWEASMHRERVHIEHHQCQQAFENILAASQAEGKHRIALFIDGLDEFEGNHANLIRELLAWASGGQNVKLCVSSREWAIFQNAFRKCPGLRLHDLTRSDIRRFIRDRFREMHIDTLLENQDNDEWYSRIDKVTWLRENILEESAGVFLWVSLVLRHVEEGLVNGDRFKDLKRLIESLPTDLESMFQQLLGSIPRNNRRLAYSMLSLAHFCSKYKNTVTVMQHSFLEEYAENENFAIDSAVRLFTAKENSDRLERTQRRIYGLCKGLLEVSRSSPFISKYSTVLGRPVRLIHRSIIEFLESPYFKQVVDLECPGFDAFDAYCQTYLILLRRVRLPTFYFAPNARPGRKPVDGNCDWGLYLQRASTLAFYGIDVLSFRQDIDSRILQHIILDRQEAVPRFCKFLNATYQALLDLRLPDLRERLPVRKRLPGLTTYVHCSPQDLITLGCAQLGFYQYFISRQDINSEQMARCVSACLLTTHFNRDEYPIVWNQTFKMLKTLFNHGASPDSIMVAAEVPALHQLLQIWSYYNEPKLAVIAFMLYHGANPRFSMTISKTKYRLTSSGYESIVFKAAWQSELPTSGHEHRWKTVRTSGLGGRRLVVKVTPQLLDLIRRCGYKIDLRTLISIWFPGQSTILQQVIDWIMELGVPVNAYYRSQLQNRFGPLLRPFFDPDHPDFLEFEGEARRSFDHDAKIIIVMLMYIGNDGKRSLKRYHEVEKEQRSEKE
ncbi:hypothetical protein F5Y05DRAFT_96938 [Hypoxylon sp. FL0543]|nr:hypothetical protein F5Y05DRAFT_96938 [Hypoxylon sp. FL0543]